MKLLKISACEWILHVQRRAAYCSRMALHKKNLLELVNTLNETPTRARKMVLMLKKLPLGACVVSVL